MLRAVFLLYCFISLAVGQGCGNPDNPCDNPAYAPCCGIGTCSACIGTAGCAWCNNGGGERGDPFCHPADLLTENDGPTDITTCQCQSADQSSTLDDCLSDCAGQQDCGECMGPGNCVWCLNIGTCRDPARAGFLGMPLPVVDGAPAPSTADVKAICFEEQEPEPQDLRDMRFGGSCEPYCLERNTCRACAGGTEPNPVLPGQDRTLTACHWCFGTDECVPEWEGDLISRNCTNDRAACPVVDAASLLNHIRALELVLAVLFVLFL